MFTSIDDDEEEIGTKMLLMVLRKYMAIGSAPVTDWKAEFIRKQGEDETAMDCWERIKLRPQNLLARIARCPMH